MLIGSINKMTNKELKQYLKDMKQFGHKLSNNKGMAICFLIRAGIYTKSGRLNKNYK